MPDAPPPSRWTPAQSLLLGGGALVAVLLAWLLQDRLGPFWMAVVGVALLWPIRRTRAAQAVLWAGGLIFGAYVLGRLGGVLTPFIAVFVAAYVLRPVVEWTVRRGLPRWLAALLATAIVTGGVIGAVLLLVPILIGQIEELTAAAIALAMRTPALLSESDLLARAEASGYLDRDVLFREITTFVPAQIEALAAQIPAFVLGLVRRVGALLGVVTTAALVPVLLFFCLKDYDELRDGMVRLLPRYDGERAYLRRAAAVFGSYVRGMLTISAISGVLVTVPLALLGTPFSVVLGVAAALLNLIPSVGSVLTYVLGVGLMLAFGTWGDVVTVLIVLAIQAIIEQAVLTPNIMSQQVGLHPVVIVLALFVSGALFGLVGFLLAVPVAALVAGLVRARREALVIDLGDDDEPSTVTT